MKHMLATSRLVAVVSAMLCLLGTATGQAVDLGSSQALCSLLTAIPCGFVTVGNHSLAPNPSALDGLPAHCNPECKERMSAGSCSALFQEYLLSCASLQCAAELTSTCGLEGTTNTAQPDFIASSDQFVSFDAEMSCSEQCSSALGSGPCADLNSTNGYQVMDSYRERLGPEGTDCQKLRCEEALLSACGRSSLAEITETDICLSPDCKTALESEACAAGAVLASKAGLTQRCEQAKCHAAISAPCFPEAILRKADICTSQCLEAISSETACSGTDYALYSGLLCPEPPDCGGAIIAACNVTSLPLNPQGACTYACKASFSSSACKGSQLDLPSLEGQMAAFCVDGYEWGGAEVELEVPPEEPEAATEIVPQTLPETVMKAECSLDTVEAICSARNTTASGSLDILATSPFCSAGCNSILSTQACSDPTVEWANSQGFNSEVLIYQSYLCTCATLAVNTCGGFQDQQALPLLGNGTEFSLTSGETVALSIATPGTCKAVVGSGFCDVPSLPLGLGTAVEGELTLLISSLRAEVEAAYPDSVPASPEELELIAEQILGPEGLGSLGNFTEDGIDPSFLETDSGGHRGIGGICAAFVFVVSVVAVFATES